MKPQLIKVPNKSDVSFDVVNERVPYFYNPFHYHSKLELTYIIESSGTRFIGDNIDNFAPGELVLVGPNLPHCWKNDVKYFDTSSQLRAEAIVIHFDVNFLGESFLKTPEMVNISKLISNSERGILFSSEATKRALKKLLCLNSLSNSLRLIHFIEILELLSRDSDYKTLSSTSTNYSITDKNLSRINTTIDYISKNYTRELTVQHLSEITHLTPNAFCRYFKKHTRKTFKLYLNELRTANVCRLLRNTDLSISEIAYANGYNSMSHFIKTFKSLKNMRPNEYRKYIKETKVIALTKST